MQTHRLGTVLILTSLGLALFFWLGPGRHIEPFYTYFYLFAWPCYLLSAAVLVNRRTGQPAAANIARLLWILAFSTLLWCLFEVFNFRLRNWSYLGVTQNIFLRWPGYALSYATVVPAILWTARVLAGNRWNAVKPRTATQPHKSLRTVGAMMLTLSLLWPDWFFPLVWGGTFFLLEPMAIRLGRYSLWLEWRAGRMTRTLPLLAAGLICGIFWEWCNHWAGAKWTYHLPWWNFGKIFEMPVLGFLGFPAFALEVHAAYEAAEGTWERLSPAARYLSAALAVAFCLLAFSGIDAWTVILWQ